MEKPRGRTAKRRSAASKGPAPRADQAIHPRSDARGRPDPGAPEGQAAAPHIVSSAHLVSPRSPELSELEFGLIVANSAFSRWIVHCMAAAGLPDLTPLDVRVLHHVNHRERDKRLSDICFVMNEDTHVISYSLKKLQALGVVEVSRKGKDVTYATSAAGREHVRRYVEHREAFLVSALDPDEAKNRQIGELARLLRMLSGVYDQAARAAASL
ncbi:winged helix DNA-binding protein [Sorangium sp. So ce291]|uniref:winged helix DNA-binding protein n=1 Tax=Sorangium sp. So ce291 TaxID=3133294 RepID=UPI003F5F197C